MTLLFCNGQETGDYGVVSQKRLWRLGQNSQALLHPQEANLPLSLLSTEDQNAVPCVVRNLSWFAANEGYQRARCFSATLPASVPKT